MLDLGMVCPTFDRRPPHRKMLAWAGSAQATATDQEYSSPVVSGALPEVDGERNLPCFVVEREQRWCGV